MIENLPDLESGYVVGRIKIDIKGSNKIFPGNELKRNFFVEIYYPAFPNENKAVYSDVFRPKNEYGMDLFLKTYNASFFRHYFESLETHTYIDARPIRGTQYPVVIFDPGGQSSSGLYINFYEKLVDAGYIVIAVDHSYDSAVSILSSGTVYQVPETFIDIFKKSQKNNSYKDLSLILQITDSQRLDDLNKTVDYIHYWNQKHPLLNGLFNIHQIGIIGHSYGGKMAVILNAINPDIKAAISLDELIRNFGMAEMLSSEEQKAFAQKNPLLIILSEDTYESSYLGVTMKQNNSDFIKALKDARSDTTFIRFISDVKHHAFMDTGYFIPYAVKYILFGKSDAKFFYSSINESIVLFFNSFLKKDNISLKRLKKHLQNPEYSILNL